MISIVKQITDALNIYNQEIFTWSWSTTPLADPRNIGIAWTIYFASIFVLWTIMKKQDSLSSNPAINYISALHNLGLSLWSIVMMLGISYDIVQTYLNKGGFTTLFCSKSDAPIPSTTVYWMYMFYVSKYVELLDTIVLIIRKKPLTFLQVWHHSTVMLETWAWIEFSLTFAAFGMLFNTFVHVFMYSYFGAAILKIQVPWKKLITRTQIVQFITSFVLSIPYLYLYSLHRCDGMPALITSIVCNGSYLLLFINFYSKTYREKAE